MKKLLTPFLFTLNSLSAINCFSQVNYEPNIKVETIAGTGVYGTMNGSIKTASFAGPTGISIDKEGNLYIVDRGISNIRKIGINDTVSTFAGIGTVGNTDGLALNSSFNLPFASDIDSLGNLYIADMDNYSIRKISTNGIVSTLPGAATQNSPSVFSQPQGVALDNFGNVYVSDTYNNAIRKINLDGTISTIAGGSYYSYGLINGSGKSVAFKYPVGLVLDKDSSIYIADAGNNVIRKINAKGIVSTFAGTETKGFEDGNVLTAKFNNPTGVCIDKDGNLIVVDRNNSAIRKISKLGIVSTLAGGSSAGLVDGKGNIAQFNYPYSATTDKLGNIYIADSGNLTIRKISNDNILTEVEKSLNLNLNIYPNPAKDYINVSLSEINGSHLHILDINGNEVFNLSLKDFNTKDSISNLENGIYVFKIISQNNTFIQKVSILK